MEDFPSDLGWPEPFHDCLICVLGAPLNWTICSFLYALRRCVNLCTFALLCKLCKTGYRLASFDLTFIRLSSSRFMFCVLCMSATHKLTKMSIRKENWVYSPNAYSGLLVDLCAWRTENSLELWGIICFYWKTMDSGSPETVMQWLLLDHNWLCLCTNLP